MKKLLLILLFLFLLIGCTNETDDISNDNYINETDEISNDYYIRPMSLDEKEQNILDLVDMQDTLLLFEYNIPEAIKVFSFSFETYEKGKLVKEESIKAGIPEMYPEGQLVIEIIEDDLMTLKVKNVVGSGYSMFTFHPARYEAVLEAQGFAHAFMENEHIITGNEDVILGVYAYDTGKGVSVYSVDQYQNNDESLHHSDLYVVFKVKLLEGFE